MIIAICPHCPKNQFEVGADSIEDAEGATIDCPYCESVLIFIEGKPVDFHAYMNSQDDRWPTDGQGTASMCIDE